jgi:hypothetical protein
MGEHGELRQDRLFPVPQGLLWLCANVAARRPLLIKMADEQSPLCLDYPARRLAGLPREGRGER